GRESRAKTPYQTLVIHWLTKVTDDSPVQGAGPIIIIGVGSHEDGRNRMPCIDQAFVEFDPGHLDHVDVGDQASCFTDTGGCEEIGCRRECLDAVTKGLKSMLIDSRKDPSSSTTATSNDFGIPPPRTRCTGAVKDLFSPCLLRRPYAPTC